MTAEQRQLFDYWLERAAGSSMPARRDIRPRDIPHLLPNVSLIEIHRSPCRLRFRLAGTRVRDIYDREVTGLYLEDIDWGGQADYWRAAHERVADTGRPAQGVVRSLRASKDHLVHFWLRLPLVTDGPDAAMILGYDVSVPVSEVPREADLTAFSPAAAVG
ncbi:MAG TPA: PAS domain-containing protein [Aestuariivirgaceae bacterium]|nr:PAS domain-containing protein [Aestuariivirgaceae bacterium]